MSPLGENHGNTGCGVFYMEGTKLERFSTKNQHTQIIEFEKYSDNF